MPDPSYGIIAADPEALLTYARAVAPLDALVRAAGRELRGIDGGVADPGVRVALARAAALGDDLEAIGVRAAALGDEVAATGLAFAAADDGASGAARPWVPGEPVPKPLLELAWRHPERVGPIDTMPPEARYLANRAIAVRERDAALAAGDLVRAARFAALADPDRRLLFLDPTGDGRVAEVFGAALDDADHVAVVVPGIMSTLANHDDELRPEGRDLAAAAAAAAPGRQVATIAWLGYDAPGVVDAPLDDDARRGGPALAGLVAGLRSLGADDVTVVGHSYGSVVVGAALLDGLDADRVVVTGSPGMLVDHVDDLGPTPVYALRSPLDVVSLTEAFGRDPSDPRFGATRLEAGGIGHSGYLVPGSVALAGIAAVVAGRPEAARRDPAHPFEVAAGWLDDLDRPATDRLGDAAGDILDVLDRQLEEFADDLPGPLGDVYDRGRGALGTAAEYGSRAAGFADRLASPDLWVDIAIDVDDLVPDEEIERGLVGVATSPVGAGPLSLLIDGW